MSRHRVGGYSPQDLMSDLICDNYPMLLVMSRFGLDLGFGESTIEDACRANGVDLYTFLSVVNLLIAADKSLLKIDSSRISFTALVHYLHQSHAYFLGYKLPSIRLKLVEALDAKDALSEVIVNYYEEYVAEVHKHMMYEENKLFPYINSAIKGGSDDGYSIKIFSEHHDKVEQKLTEFKHIIIKYYPVKTTNELTNVLYDIFSCERDLVSHTEIEDYLLVPAMKELERTNNQL